MCGSHRLRPLQHAYLPTFFPLARSRPLQGLQDGESKSCQRQEEDLFPGTAHGDLQIRHRGSELQSSHMHQSSHKRIHCNSHDSMSVQ